MGLSGKSRQPKRRTEAEAEEDVAEQPSDKIPDLFEGLAFVPSASEKATGTCFFAHNVLHCHETRSHTPKGDAGAAEL